MRTALSTTSPRRGPGGPARTGLLLAAALALLPGACSEGGGPLGGPPGGAHRGGAAGAAGERGPAPAGSLWIQALDNSGFELLADSTTDPDKYGAYWAGAFLRKPGRSAHLVVQGPFHGGRRSLRLTPGLEVHQKIPADPRWTKALRVELHTLVGPGATLEVTLEDGPGRRTTATVSRPAKDPSREGPEWAPVVMDIGRQFAEEHGEPPRPRMVLRLVTSGLDGSSVLVDDVQAWVPGPQLSPGRLRRHIEDLVRWQLEVWFLPEGPDGEGGGLGLVDPESGYVLSVAYDVDTGDQRVPSRLVSFHTIHQLLRLWLEDAHARGDQAEIDRWTPALERVVASMLANNFDPDTGLPRNIWWPAGNPNDNASVTVGAYVDFLLDARGLLPDAQQRADVLAACRRVADALVRLQREHDLPPDEVENTWTLDGVELVGEFPNWYGHIPNKITPKGEIDTPKRFNTAWAVVTERTFWYHVFKSAAAIMRVHELDPRPGDVAAVRRVVGLYHREWDAHRYQLENDTDDHYGYLCEDLLPLLQHSDGTVTAAFSLVQEATDHRLDRSVGLDESLWIQAIRLGTACAGDSPRAFKGVLDLYELPSTLNPLSSGLPLYRDAIQELARNDFKGRQLTNAQFTESFFEDWEMVCICYRGNLQGDCRYPPEEGWHGDVGDTFGGPPTTAIDAQVYAWRTATPAEKPAILARLGTIHHVTESTMRRRYGYLYGLDADVARQYELPEKYTIGVSTRSPAGLGYVLAWARMLEHLPADD